MVLELVVWQAIHDAQNIFITDAPFAQDCDPGIHKVLGNKALLGLAINKDGDILAQVW